MPGFKISPSRQLLVDAMVENLPKLRKGCHLSQTDVAKKIGKSRQTVSDIERGVAPMGWDTFLALVLVFKMYKIFDNTIEVAKYRDLLRKEILN